MSQAVKPVVRELTEREMDELLTRNWVGRIAFSWHDRVDIEPIHYVYDAPWIFGRTTVGAKLLALAHNQWCAFETDDIRELFEWQSVVVKGPFSALNSALGRGEKFDRAVTAFRKLVPNAFTEDDPTPDRTVVWGIHASEVSGRAMSSEVPDRALR